jgi:hypothetical protein
MDRAEISRLCDLIRDGEIESCDLLLAGSNRVFVVSLVLDGWQGQAIYKPRRGEVPLWDFPDGTLYRREYAAFLVSLELGWDLIPPTVIRDGPYGIGSVQSMVDVRGRASFFRETAEDIPVFQQVALFDYLVNNADRKAGHFLKDRQDRLWVVDHGLTFNTVPKLRTVLWEFAGQKIPHKLLSDVRKLQNELKRGRNLRKELLRLLEQKEIDALELRVNRIIKNPIFPHPSSRWSVPFPW